MKIRPLGARVLVEPVETKEEVKGGIYIPDTAKEKPQEGKVLAIGKKRDDDGKEIPFDVKVGDTVLMPKYGGTEVKIDDKTYQIVREEDLLGVIELNPTYERKTKMAGKANQVRRRRASEDPRRRPETRQGRQVHARPRRPQRRSSTRSSAPRRSPRTA